MADQRSWPSLEANAGGPAKLDDPTVDLHQEMDVDDQPTSSSHVVVVVPGEEVTVEQGFLRGHGTYVRRDFVASGGMQHDDDSDASEDDDDADELDGGGGESKVAARATKEGGDTLIASVAGVVERVNRLISVRPLRARYTGEVGDVVVGRIVEVAPKRWRVDIGAKQPAVLMLGSVILPGGAQRRRTLEDQLQMRQLYQEHDLISAEVAQFFNDGSISIQTRSLKFGKLENGTLVHVPPVLIRRRKDHFVSLSCGVDLVIGHNGNIWLTETTPEDMAGGDGASSSLGGGGGGGGASSRVQTVEQLEAAKLLEARRMLTADARERIAKVRAAVLVLSGAHRAVSPESIMQVYSAAETNGIDAKAMLTPDVAAELLASL
jgi:exosome complex component RRP4